MLSYWLVTSQVALAHTATIEDDDPGCESVAAKVETAGDDAGCENTAPEAEVADDDDTAADWHCDNVAAPAEAAAASSDGSAHIAAAAAAAPGASRY